MSDPDPGKANNGPNDPNALPAESEQNAGTGSPPPPPLPRTSFPWARLLYSIGFSFVAWAVFWLIVLLLAPLHYITIAITGRANEELRQMSLRAVHYLFELLNFITGARDEKPFPLGPFPSD